MSTRGTRPLSRPSVPATDVVTIFETLIFWVTGVTVGFFFNFHLAGGVTPSQKLG